MSDTTRPALRRAGAGVLLLLAPMAILLCWLLVHDELPRRLATHFGLDGTPDGYSSPGPFTLVFGIVTAILAGLGIAGLVLARRQAVVRVAVALAGWMAWLFAAIVVSVLWPQRGIADGIVHLRWFGSLLPIGIACVLGLAIHGLVPPGESALSSTVPARASYTLKPGERATWVGRARSRAFLVIGVVVALLGAVAVVWLGPVALFAAFIGLIIGWTSEILVRVDDRGVSAHFGPVGWPSFRTPLARIEAADAQLIEPMQWGGWGFRFGRRGTALVVRRGPGLVLSRRGASDLAITVDGAEQAAELVNALLARERIG